MGSNPCRKIPPMGVAQPVVGSPFSGTGRRCPLEAEIMGRVWDRRGEEMVKLALFLYFVNSGKTIQFLCKLQLNTIIN